MTAPAPIGGLERVVLGLAAGHRAAGHRVHVAAVLAEAEPEHPFLAALRTSGIEVHLAVLPPRAYAREHAFLKGLYRRLRPAVVHTHGYRSDLVGGAVARRLGVPTVATVHGFVGGSRRGRLYEWLQRRALRRFDAVAAVSRAQVEEIVAAGASPERVHLVPNAWAGEIDPTTRSAVRAELGIPSGSFHVGWVGRLSGEKGADVLLDALPALADLPLVVSVVGGGPERPGLQARHRALGAPCDVRWWGAVTGAARLFPAFDAFVLSSRTEGTPIALLEAMAARSPIVATRVGGVPDVVTEREALLIAPQNPAELANAVRALYSDPDAARVRAEAAEQRLHTHFARGPWLARYEELYRAVLSPSPGLSIR